MQEEYFSLLENAFRDDFTLSVNFGYSPEQNAVIGFQNKFIGYLKVKSGKIGACDPFEIESYLPFDNIFPKGEFPIQLSITKFDDDERVAFARIKFSDTQTVKWNLAIRSGDGYDPESYGVDSGTGGFFDVDVADDMAKIASEDEDWFVAIESEMHKVRASTRSWYLYEVNDLNVAFFSSGQGDGSYKTYVGIDQNGQITQLVTDFDLFTSEESEEEYTID